MSRTGQLTSSAVDARDFLRARGEREDPGPLARRHPGRGHRLQARRRRQPDPARRSIKVRTKYPDMVLVHGGGPGAEKIAARWAESRGVHQVVCKPDWNAHGRAAPFRRNDQLLSLLPKGVISFPGSGISENLVDKAIQLGIPVKKCAV